MIIVYIAVFYQYYFSLFKGITNLINLTEIDYYLVEVSVMCIYSFSNHLSANVFSAIGSSIFSNIYIVVLYI